ncbi:alpha/beta hydrolase [Sphingomonas sp. CGMCC 1.13654]|uniref:Alpha/beta hydrolase n=2 Tax=Sphingomonas chungangi TaxID=2683589 RepID=A0A838L5U0_9SPHN|nr:alpha/beta hydrolase [Sphingomonas chungangi]MVW57811.1 alpha/beta hydrolase fold domain-containing protein [Sphingomonas chungangi]
MNTIDLVDPDLRPLLDLFPTRLLTVDNLAEARARILPIPAAEVSGISRRTLSIASRTGGPDIGLQMYKPDRTGPFPCVFHMHGGGFVMGAARDMAPIHMMLAHELNCAIVSVDYRLAPEAIFPANIEDCYDALAWTFANAGSEGVDRDRIGVMGESAGGGLAAALALLARDRGEYALAFQHLVYPMLDDRTGSAGELHPTAGEFIWPAANNRFGWAALLGCAPGSNGVSPYAAAARADDLSGLPPTFLATGALDLFVDEDMAYAQRLLRAGIPVEFHIYPGAFHAFDIAPGVPVAVQARRDMVDALRRFLQPKSCNLTQENCTD